MQPWREKLKGKKVLLYTGGVKSWSVIAALQDLGMEVVATGTKKSTEEDKARSKDAGVDVFFDKADFREGALAETLREMLGGR